MNNLQYVNAYKNDDKIITDYYKMYANGKKYDVTGIISPLKIDNRQLMSPTDHLKDSPHCAAYSAATIVESLYWKSTGQLLLLDSHQVYAVAKKLDGNININGTYLEVAMQAVISLCKGDKRFSFLDGAEVKMFYNDLTEATVKNVKHLLHKHDFVQVGFDIDEGWYDCNSIDYVIHSRGKALGGHAVNLCGYDESGFYVLNQWGTGFGCKGFAVMPYSLFLQLFMYGALIAL